MKTTDKDKNFVDDDDDDIKIVLPQPITTHVLDALGNKIGEIEVDNYDHFQNATESYQSTDRIIWGAEDTSLLLEKYGAYITQVGPRKRFHSKKYMWNQIANDIYAKFKLIITGVQCENRYKTICKRKKASAENNSKPSNSKAVTPSEEEKGSLPEESSELDIINNEGHQYLEKLEQRNQELMQQIDQYNIRFVTLVEKLEKTHSRQQQKLDKSIQENREQHNVEFSSLLKKLDKIHETIQEHYSQQQQTVEKVIKENQEQRKTEFAALLNVLEKVHKSIERGNEMMKKQGQSASVNKTGRSEELKRSKSRSKSPRRNSRPFSPHSPARKRHCSATSLSPSTSKCRYSSPTSSRNYRRSRSNSKYNSESRTSTTKNNQHSPHSSRSSNKYDKKYKSNSRSPNRSHRRSAPDTCHKHRDQCR